MPALLLEVHVVEHLLVHLARGHGVAALQDAVRQRRLPVVDVGDDREVADEAGVGHFGERGMIQSRLHVPSGQRDRAAGRRGVVPAPSRRNRSSPAHAIIAALSVVRERSGRCTGTPFSLAPGRERRAQLRVGGHAPGERERPDALVARARSSTRSSRAATIARWKEASRSTSSGSRAFGIERRAVHAALLELAQHRGLQAREGEVARAVAGAADRERIAVAAAARGDRGRRRGRPDSRAPPGARSCRRPRRARRRACGRAERCGPPRRARARRGRPRRRARGTGSVTGSGGSPSGRRNAEKRCPSRWLTPDERDAAREGERLAGREPDEERPDQARARRSPRRARRPRAARRRAPSASSRTAGRFSRCARAATSGHDAAVAARAPRICDETTFEQDAARRRRGRRPRSRRRRSRCRGRTS